VEELLPVEDGDRVSGSGGKLGNSHRRRDSKNSNLRANDQTRFFLPVGERISYSHALLGTSQRCIEATQFSIANARNTLMSSLERISTSHELITMCDQRLRSYSVLCSKENLVPGEKRAEGLPEELEKRMPMLHIQADS
jgi:hypothetical protein